MDSDDTAMKPRKPPKSPSPSDPARGARRMARGFVQTGGILKNHIRSAGEKRGFAETRLLTHWPEIVGEALADISRPIKVSYGRQGLGASLTILTNGANAPIIQAQLPLIREKVNACYGYAAISNIRITQTAETGFAETGTPFEHARRAPVSQAAERRNQAGSDTRADDYVADVHDESLRTALAVLGRNILTRKAD